jgi:acetate kinase
LDREHNQALGGKEGAFTADGSTLTGYVIPTDEELLIARDTVRIILGQPHPA